jgi:CsoR family transcriptional regulator, copper-sensing transcriptional repressor
MNKEKEDLIHRIRIVKGHLSAIEKMVDNDTYCVEVIHQSRAVQKALKKFDEVLVESHLNHCIPEQIKKGDTNKIVEDLLRIYDYK